MTAVPVVTRVLFCERGQPGDRLVLACLFSYFTFRYDIQRIHFQAYITNRTPRIYILDRAGRLRLPSPEGRR